MNDMEPFDDAFMADLTRCNAKTIRAMLDAFGEEALAGAIRELARQCLNARLERSW